MNTLSLHRERDALNDDQLRALAPSIFAPAPHGDMTTRYHMIPTYQIVAGMRENGFLPFSARQSISRKPAGGAFARHEIRFRHVDTLAHLQRLRDRHAASTNKHTFVADEVFDEIGFVNAHDGSAGLELFHAMHRVACLNGLIVSAGAGERVVYRHNASIVDNVIEGATRLVEEVTAIVDAREGMRALSLDKEEQVAFATAAAELRYGGASPIEPIALLAPRRVEDDLPTLWHTFNVVQENMVKGGVRGHTVNTGRRMTTQGITSITTDHAINRMLWNLAAAARNMATTLDLEEAVAA